MSYYEVEYEITIKRTEKVYLPEGAVRERLNCALHENYDLIESGRMTEEEFLANNREDVVWELLGRSRERLLNEGEVYVERYRELAALEQLAECADAGEN